LEGKKTERQATVLVKLRRIPNPGGGIEPAARQKMLMQSPVRSIASVAAPALQGGRFSATPGSKEDESSASADSPYQAG